MLKVYTWERPHVHHYRLFIMHVCVYARASVFNSSSVNRVDTVRWMAGMCIPPPLVIWNFPSLVSLVICRSIWLGGG